MPTPTVTIEPLSAHPSDDLIIDTLSHWRNLLRPYCREHRLIGPEHQMAWWERYLDDSLAKPPRQLLYLVWGDVEILPMAGRESRIVHHTMPVGVGGFCYIDWHLRRAELSLYIAPAHQHHGYGREALRLLMDEAFGQHNLHTLHCGLHDWDTRGCSFLRNAGWCYEGVYRDAAWANGKYNNLVLYDFTARDYKELKRD